VFNKLLVAVVALGCLGLAVFGVLAWEPAIAPVAPPTAASFAPELVAKGEALVGRLLRGVQHGPGCKDFHLSRFAS
jgi:hypothetical protein